MQKVFPISIESANFPKLDTFKSNCKLGQDIKIQIIHPEFSSVCPVTGYPDFAKIILRYVPDKLCVELKSWKIYLSSFYGVGCFHEDITQRIFDKFLEVVKPKWVQMITEWGARGGLKTMVQADYWQRGEDNEPVELTVDIFNWEGFERSSEFWDNM